MTDLKNTYKERLEALATSITSQDIKDAIYQIPISRTTLDKYLNGEVIKIDTANKLIEFLTAKVNDRLKVLSDS